MMRRDLLKKNKGIIFGLVIASVVAIGYNGVSNSRKVVSAETVYDNIVDTETDKIEDVMGTEIKELDVNDDLSSEETVVYEDSDDNLYQFENEEVVSYYNCENSNAKMKLSEQQIKMLAQEYLNTISDGSDYVLYEGKYNEYRKTYKFYYYKYLGEYKTSDAVYIEIDEYGVVKAFANTDEGVFDGIKIKEMSYEDIKQKAIDSSNYDKNLYNISVDDIMIVKEECLKYQVTLFCYDKDENIIYDDIVYVDVEE